MYIINTFVWYWLSGSRSLGVQNLQLQALKVSPQNTTLMLSKSLQSHFQLAQDRKTEVEKCALVISALPHCHAPLMISGDGRDGRVIMFHANIHNFGS